MNRNKLKKNSGITLIALVITIIVMLILVAVTISMAINGGLFDYAGDATGKTNNAIREEQQLGSGKVTIDNKVYNSIDEYLGTSGGNDSVELPEGIKVGDYVNYIPTTGTYKIADGTNGSGYTTTDGYQTFTTETGNSALKWRVLAINQTTGEVELVAATAAQTSIKLYLKGADGYNHSVDILNDLCEALYSNENGAIARSIKVEDVNAKTTYDYRTFTDNSTNLTYGDTRQLSSTYGTYYMEYPNIYSQEKGYGTENIFNVTGLNESEGLNDGVIDENGVATYSTVTGSIDGNKVATDPYLTYTDYNYNVEYYLNTNLGINTAPAGLLNVETSYYVASRCVGERLDPCYPFFMIRAVTAGGILRSCALFNPPDKSEIWDFAVRPVVSLGSNVTLVKDTVNSTEKITHWNIEYTLKS